MKQSSLFVNPLQKYISNALVVNIFSKYSGIKGKCGHRIASPEFPLLVYCYGLLSFSIE